MPNVDYDEIIKKAQEYSKINPLEYELKKEIYEEFEYELRDAIKAYEKYPQKEKLDSKDVQQIGKTALVRDMFRKYITIHALSKAQNQKEFEDLVKKYKVELIIYLDEEEFEKIEHYSSNPAYLEQTLFGNEYEELTKNYNKICNAFDKIIENTKKGNVSFESPADFVEKISEDTEFDKDLLRDLIKYAADLYKKELYFLREKQQKGTEYSQISTELIKEQKEFNKNYVSQIKSLENFIEKNEEKFVEEIINYFRACETYLKKIVKIASCCGHKYEANIKNEFYEKLSVFLEDYILKTLGINIIDNESKKYKLTESIIENNVPSVFSKKIENIFSQIKRNFKIKSKKELKSLKKKILDIFKDYPYNATFPHTRINPIVELVKEQDDVKKFAKTITIDYNLEKLTYDEYKNLEEIMNRELKEIMPDDALRGDFLKELQEYLASKKPFGKAFEIFKKVEKAKKIDKSILEEYFEIVDDIAKNIEINNNIKKDFIEFLESVGKIKTFKKEKVYINKEELLNIINKNVDKVPELNGKLIKLKEDIEKKHNERDKEFEKLVEPIKKSILWLEGLELYTEKKVEKRFFEFEKQAQETPEAPKLHPPQTTYIKELDTIVEKQPKIKEKEEEHLVKPSKAEDFIQKLEGIVGRRAPQKSALASKKMVAKEIQASLPTSSSKTKSTPKYSHDIPPPPTLPASSLETDSMKSTTEEAQEITAEMKEALSSITDTQESKAGKSAGIMEALKNTQQLPASSSQKTCEKKENFFKVYKET